MKKFLIFLCLLIILPTTLVSCNKKEEKIKICLITNGENINDKEINEQTWQGIDKFLKNKNYTPFEDYNYLIPDSNTTEDLLKKISEAVNWGANAIICPGFVFNEAIYIAQKRYKNVKFLIEDGCPCDSNFSKNVTNNTIASYFKENELGFYAGYSAVKEGYTNLGFIGGGAIPNVQRFGIGFIAGSYYSAFESNININFDNDSYVYVNSFTENDNVKATANILYKNGVDLLLCSAGKADQSVIDAAEKQNKKVITSDYNKVDISDSILTSAVKNYDVMVQLFLKKVFNEFNGGKVSTIGSENDAISLVFDDNNFKKFNINDYNKIYNEVKTENIIVPETYESLLTFINNLNFDLKITKENISGLLK